MYIPSDKINIQTQNREKQNVIINLYNLKY